MFTVFKKFMNRKICCTTWVTKKNITREVLNINNITYVELIKMIKEGAILIDVRSKQEFLENHINGAILIPNYEINKKIEKIVPNKEKNIILYCQNGGRSKSACEVLNNLGYTNVYNLKGGIEEI